MMKKTALLTLLCVLVFPVCASAQSTRIFTQSMVNGAPATIDMAVVDVYGNVRVPSLLTISCDNAMNTTITLPGADGYIPVVTGSGVRDVVIDGVTYSTTGGNVSVASVIWLPMGTFTISPRCKTVIATCKNATPHTVWLTAEYEQ
jgi:hypothetical protein